MTMKTECGYCEGECRITCRQCSGTGGELYKCSACRGSGRVKCDDCNGLGIVEIEVEIEETEITNEQATNWVANLHTILN